MTVGFPRMTVKGLSKAGRWRRGGLDFEGGNRDSFSKQQEREARVGSDNPECKWHSLGWGLATFTSKMMTSSPLTLPGEQQ